MYESFKGKNVGRRYEGGQGGDKSRQRFERRDSGMNNNRGGYVPRSKNGTFDREQSFERGGYGERGNEFRGNSSRSGFGSFKSGGFSSERRFNKPRVNEGFSSNRGDFRGGNDFAHGENGPKLYREHKRTSNYDPHAKYSRKKRLEYKEVNLDPNQPLRLNKFLANAGVCSRRDADKYIAAGVVTVNGEIVTELGTKVLRTDVVKFHDNAIKPEKKVYVLLNKPKGYVTTSEDPQNRKTVMDLVEGACPERIYPVGRLDRNTTGVLLLTNDGELASKLTHPKFLKKKIYHVHTDQNVSAADIRRIAEGITLEDGEIKADAIEYASPTDKKQVGIEIHSGRNRIVRRIFESLGYHVVKLDRVYFAGLTKKNLQRGDWRFLTEKEVNMLRMGAYE